MFVFRFFDSEKRRRGIGEKNMEMERSVSLEKR